MSLLTLKAAEQYATEITGGTPIRADYRTVDSIEYVCVTFAYGVDMQLFEMDVWQERREDGTAYLYGEW